MRKVLIGLALLFGTLNAESIKLGLTRKRGPKRPQRKYHGMPESSELTKAVDSFQSFLALMTRQSTSIDVDVDNFDVYYATTMYLGSQKTPFDVQLDTGSNILVVQDTSCTQCTATFDSSQSSTFVPSSTPD